MIKYALVCDKGHEFESWFQNSDAFDTQAKRGFVDCPHCGSIKVEKALMSPSVATSRKKDAGREAAIKAQAIQQTPHTAQAGGGAPGQVAPAGVTLLDEQQVKLREALRELHAKIAETTVDVGDKFTEEARRIHDGDAPARSIRGAATFEQAKELWEEGIPVLPVPQLPDDKN